jgi:lipopolysaccharide transport system ATP-binding protein
MDKDVAIKVENISKKYCKSLKRSMIYGVKDIGRNSFGLNSYPDKLRKDEFWAINDVSFEVKRGETLGIIGPNGSGKTTLLKMLNGIFWPDKGKITINGRVGALIEVGAGFHPLLTGRENIYVNGAILGMTKKEIDEKFDSIVEFADIGDFLDVPVKHYSSGMFVRLGFAVAVHCEPDVLLVDEILSVGDQDFQIKCFRRLNELLQKGIIVILVSHSMAFIERICKKTILLSKGKEPLLGDTVDIVKKYLIKNSKGERKGDIQNSGNPIVFTQGRIKQINSDISVELEFESSIDIANPNIMIILWKGHIRVCNIVSGKGISFLRAGKYYVRLQVSNLRLSYGHYHISVRLRDYFNPLCTYGINGRLADLCVLECVKDDSGVNLEENGVVISDSDVFLKQIAS